MSTTKESFYIEATVLLKHAFSTKRRSAPPTADRNSTGNVAASVTWSTVAARLRLVTFGVKSVGCRLSSLANLRPYYFSSKTSRHVCLTKCVNFFDQSIKVIFKCFILGAKYSLCLDNRAAVLDLKN